MKDVKWQDCVCHGAIGSYPPKTGKMLQLYDRVTPGMKVSARYKDLDVHLQIKNQIEEGVFAATVLFFEPVCAEKPDDLDQGNDVKIDRQHICWLYED